MNTKENVPGILVLLLLGQTLLLVWKHANQNILKPSGILKLA